jgi:hypothetical protein
MAARATMIAVVMTMTGQRRRRGLGTAMISVMSVPSSATTGRRRHDGAVVAA